MTRKYLKITRSVLNLVLPTLLAFVFLNQTNAQTSPNEPNKILEPAQIIERELAGGQTHKYSLKAQANEFLLIKVEQKEVDVVVRLFDKDGKKLAEIDGPNGSKGVEVLKFVTAATDVYVIEVGSFDATAAKGIYVISREPPRIATEKDRTILQAETAFREAAVLSRQKEVESKKTAREKFLAASRLYESLADKENQAQSLLQAAAISSELKEKPVALDHYKTARNLFQSTGNRNLEAYALNNLALISLELKENEEALEFYRQALEIFTKNRDIDNKAITLNRMGLIYIQTGEKQKGLELFDEVLAMLPEIKNPLTRATRLNNIGSVYSDLGNKRKALELYIKALPILQADPTQKITEAKLLSNIGGIYSNLDEKQTALDFYKQSLKIYENLNKESEKVEPLAGIGTIYSDSGDTTQALKYFNQALEIVKKQPDDTTRRGIMLNNLGSAYNQAGEYQKALEFFNQALCYRVKGSRGEAVTLHNIGLSHSELRDWTKALDYFKSALDLRIKNNDKSGEAKTLDSIGRVYFAIGNKEEATKYYYRALPLRREVGDLSGEAGTLANLMSVWDSNGNPRLAIFYGKQAINKFQELRQDVNKLDRELQKTYLGTIENPYRKLVELLIRQGRLPEAEQVLAMLKEDEYFRFVRSGEIESFLEKRINLSTEEKKALERYEKIAAELTEIGDKYIELDKKRLKVSDKELEEIVRQQAELDKKLEAARTVLLLFLESLKKEFDEKDNRVTQIDDAGLQAKVTGWKLPTTVVISTIVGKENLYIVVTTSGIQTAHIVPITEENLNKLVSDFRFAVAKVDPTKDPTIAAQKLYDILIKPLERDLAGVKAKNLVWSLDGILRYAPIAALWDKDKGYLAQNYTNTIITLASTQNLGEKSENKKDWQILGVGVSKKYEGFAPLSYVAEELQAIINDASISPKTKQRGIMQGKRLLNEEFTSDALRNYLGRYQIVHTATHFSFISDTKNESSNSFLLLGDGNKLTLSDIRKSGTIFDGVQLLTLSACDTAYGGKDANGSEIESFGVLAQKKGAKAVIATLWRVNDESTRDLMVKFYGAYKKPAMTKAEALQQAQISLMQTKNFAHPYYWSPFVLIGNWR